MFLSKFFSIIYLYISPYILLSILHAYPGPSRNRQPHITKFPPPSLSVSNTVLGVRPSPFLFHIHFSPFQLNISTLASSDQITLFQSFKVQYLCVSAKSSLAFLYPAVRSASFYFLTAFIHQYFRHTFTV